RVELAGLDQMLHLGYCDFGGHGTDGIEVTGRLAEDQVAVSVSLPSTHKGEVSGQCSLEQVGLAVELRGLFCRGCDGDRAILAIPPGKTSLRDLGAHAGDGVERRNAD